VLPLNFQTTFDIATSGYQGWGYVRGGVYLSIGAIAILVLSLSIQSKPRRIKAYGWLMITAATFGLFWSALAFNDTYKPYRNLRAALLAGQCEVVVGTVENFRPVHPGAVYLECFTVNGTKFEYSDFIESPGFHQTNEHGGPISAGLKVRIHHLNGVIARLELAL
jgi:hypothetical protein